MCPGRKAERRRPICHVGKFTLPRSRVSIWLFALDVLGAHALRRAHRLPVLSGLTQRYASGLSYG